MDWTELAVQNVLLWNFWIIYGFYAIIVTIIIIIIIITYSHIATFLRHPPSFFFDDCMPRKLVDPLNTSSLTHAVHVSCFSSLQFYPLNWIFLARS